MEIQEILNLAIMGGLLSWFLEYVTKKFSKNEAKGLTIGLSIIVGGLYWWLSQTGSWESILGVLVSASTFYAFILKK